MGAAVIYLFPLAFDIIVSISLFAGRHSLAERGMDARTVGSLIAIYGIGYIIASLCMGKIIRPAYARLQMLASILLIIILLILLANTEKIRLIQVLFCGIPFATSLFFNAFQSFMLGVNATLSKPLTKTVAHYTFAWSVGYAAGPALSSLLKGSLGWAASYYAGAAAAAVIGVIALLFRPPAAVSAVRREKPVSGPSLCVPAWIGAMFCWTGWNMLATFWPVHAELLHFPASIKGLVEFGFAISQAVAALLLAAVPAGYYRKKYFSLISLAGVAGALFFAAGGRAAFFAAGAVLYGVYSAHCLCNMVFQASLEPGKAVKRIALNEVLMGVSFLAGPVLASMILALTKGFFLSYLCLSGLLAAGAAIQALSTRRKLIK